MCQPVLQTVLGATSDGLPCLQAATEAGWWVAMASNVGLSESPLLAVASETLTADTLR